MSLQVLQLTDIHLFADQQRTLHEVNTEQSLQKVLQAVANDRQPDVVILSGDLTEKSEAAAYQRLVQHCQMFSCPVYAIAGNHDDLDVLQASVAESNIELQQSVLTEGWHIILLNSVIPGHAEGLLADSELAYLRTALASQPDLPALVVLHHHAQPVNGTMDQIMLRNHDAFNAVLADHPQVKVVLCGHVHQEYDQIKNNIRYLASPSTCYQITENNSQFIRDTSALPGYRWLSLNDDGTIETTVVRVE